MLAGTDFDTWRRRVGLPLAPVVLVILWLVPFPDLGEPAHRLLAIFGLVVVLWITEAIPLAVTALLGPALCVVAGVAPERELFKGFGNPIIFLFLGSFLLAEAMFQHGLNRRIAFGILGWPWLGRSPARLLAAFAGITGFLSMWISNTTATAMMYPIGLSILREVARRQSEREGRTVAFRDLRFGTGLMLVAAFASSIGGMATPVGTPPNLIGLGQLERACGVKITFFQWMGFGVPLALVLLAALVVYFNRMCPGEASLLEGSTDWIQAERRRLGPLTRGERNVVGAFLTTVTLWLAPGVVALWAGADTPAGKWLNTHVPEAVAALLGAGLLFVLPVDGSRGKFTLDWAQARGIDWGTILLFGGGLALGEAMFTTGLAKWIGEGLAAWFDARTPLALTILFTVIAVVLTETTSNTATANMIVPVAIAVATAAGVSPLGPAIACCLGASLAFMLPVSTPPNAVVFGSGCVPLVKMVRHGVIMDLISILGVVATVHWLAPLVLR